MSNELERKAQQYLLATGQSISDPISDLSSELPAELSVFDPAEYLDSEEMIAAYLNEMLEEGNPALIAQALGDVARARGMTDIAKETGMAREALYKALRPDSSPRLETIMKVMKAVGLRLVVEPIHQSEHSAA